MLKLTLRPGRVFKIGDDITVHIIDFPRKRQVMLGIEAPKALRIENVAVRRQLENDSLLEEMMREDR